MDGEREEDERRYWRIEAKNRENEEIEVREWFSEAVQPAIGAQETPFWCKGKVPY